MKLQTFWSKFIKFAVCESNLIKETVTTKRQKDQKDQRDGYTKYKKTKIKKTKIQKDQRDNFSSSSPNKLHEQTECCGDKCCDKGGKEVILLFYLFSNEIKSYFIYLKKLNKVYFAYNHSAYKPPKQSNTNSTITSHGCG